MRRASCCQRALLLCPSTETRLSSRPRIPLLAGIDQHVGVLVEHELGLVLSAALVDDVESGALLADGRRFASRRCPCAPRHAGTDVGAPFERLAVVDLLHRKLGRVKLLDSVDRRGCRYSSSMKPIFTGPLPARFGGRGEAEVAQIGGQGEAAGDAGGGRGAEQQAAAVGGRPGAGSSARGRSSGFDVGWVIVLVPPGFPALRPA